MTKLIALSALAIILSLGAAGDAMAWTRSGSAVGPRGTTSFNGAGSCANGSCSSTGTRTSPGGYTTTRQSTGTCANGTCTGNTQVTGPMGYSRMRSGTITR